VISIVTGPGRVAFVLISFVIVLCFYKLKPGLPRLISRPLETFGIATYGVYLIHPVVFLYLSYIMKQLDVQNGTLQFLLVAILTIAVSVLSYHYFEEKLIRLGKRLTSSKSTAVAVPPGKEVH
jgi:exopolysaccharide production protein ExoZ